MNNSLSDFEKYHGAGNDFIILSGNEDLQKDPNKVYKLCERRFGIGADGMIWVSTKGDNNIEMVYHNADGHRGSFCGNGARCAIAYAYEKEWCQEEGKLIFDGKARDFKVIRKDLIAVEFPIQTQVKRWHDGYFINTGSPHLIFQVDRNELESMNIQGTAHPFRHHSDFVKIGGTNVNFFSVDGEEIIMRTFERGVEAETHACGTGAMAVGIVAMNEIDLPTSDRVRIQAKGGLLEVSNLGNYWLTGPAEAVFGGKLPVI